MAKIIAECIESANFSSNYKVEEWIMSPEEWESVSSFGEDSDSKDWETESDDDY